MYSDECFIVILLTTVFFASTYCQKLQEQKIQSYASCRTDRDCKVNAFCFGNDDTADGKCKCKEGFELIRNTTFYNCLPGIPLGEVCEDDVECALAGNALAICSESKLCDCGEGSNSYEGKCYMNVEIDGICIGDGNCLLSSPYGNRNHAFCTYGKCTCRANDKPSADGTRCLTASALGDPCTSNEDCEAIPNASCSGHCQCAAGYTLSRNDSTCVKAATKFGEDCDFDSQCSTYLLQSICSNRQCGCLSTFHGYGDRCVRTRKPGEGCEEDAQCIYEEHLNENVKCENTCKCVYGTKGDGTCNIEKVRDGSAGDGTAFTISVFCVGIALGLTFFKLL